MNYLIDPPKTIAFSPDTEIEEILQNVRTILTTVKGSVPMDRDFGIDGGYVDKPMPLARAKLSAEIMKAVQKYEPRVTISSISFSGSQDGVLVPKVEVRINGTK